MHEPMEFEGELLKRAENLFPGDRVKVWGPDLEVKTAQPFGPGETATVNGFLVRGPGTHVSFIDGDQTFDAFYPPGVAVEWVPGEPSVVDQPQDAPADDAPAPDPGERASGGLMKQSIEELQDNPPPADNAPAPDPGERAQGGLLDLSSRIVPAHVAPTEPPGNDGGGGDHWTPSQ